MPDYAKAVLLLMASFVMTSDTATTAHRVTRKNSKKNEAPPVCTWQNFVGSSKYRNCEMVETKINIGCGDEDADDITRTCKVTEHPWIDEKKEDDTDAAATNTACVVHGSFDPKTHITTDSATGFCHLKFLPLFNSCDVDANGSPSGGFGMKAEIHNSRNTENHNDDNSGMLLRFSRTGGEEYYNVDDPRETVPLHGVIPAHRKLQSTCRKPCEESVGTYDSGKDYCYTYQPNKNENWWQFCWNSQNQCPPNGYFMYGRDALKDGTCNFPCDDFVYTFEHGQVYDPSVDFCYKEVNFGQYCWNALYLFSGIQIWPSGNWEEKSGRAYNDCGPKCDNTVYNPGGNYCYKVKNVDQYCWSLTDGLPSGNWEGTGGRAYNNCGPKCDTVYDPSRDFCYKVINVDQYCWYPTDGLPSGNWEGKSGRAYNNCGPKCDTF